MKVSLGTVEVDDRVRRALRAYYGKTGLATRAEVRAFFRSAADGTLADVLFEYDEELSLRAARAAEPTDP